MKVLFRKDKFTMFQMTKYLSEMMKSVKELQSGLYEFDQDDRDDDTDAAASSAKKRKSSSVKEEKAAAAAKKSKKDKSKKEKIKKEKIKKEAGEGGGDAPATGFRALVQLSPSLGAFLGTESLPRTEVRPLID